MSTPPVHAPRTVSRSSTRACRTWVVGRQAPAEDLVPDMVVGAVPSSSLFAGGGVLRRPARLALDRAPAERLATRLSELFPSRRRRLDLQAAEWEYAFDRGKTTARTTLTWTDPHSADVTAAVVLRDAADGGCDWAITAEASRTWTTDATSPGIVVGLAEVFPASTDSAGFSLMPPVSCFDVPREVSDRLCGDGGETSWVVEALAHPDRQVAVLLLNGSWRSLKQWSKRSGPLTSMIWPGLTHTVIIVGSARADAQRLLPAHPVPANGARIVMPPGHGLDDIVITQLTNAPALRKVFRDLIDARADLQPPGLAADATDLLDRKLGRTAKPLPCLVPAPRPAPEPATAETDRLHRKITDLTVLLEETRRQLSDTRAQLHQATDRATSAERDAAHLRSRIAAAEQAAALEAHLAQVLTENGKLAEEIDRVETERDDAVRQRGILSGRLAALSPAADPDPGNADAVPASFPELLEHVRGWGTLVLDDVDEQAAALLDHYPKAARWRRKTLDSLSTLSSYVLAVREASRHGAAAGPHLADVLAYVRSGVPGILISANTVALDESDNIGSNGRFRDARTFPVRSETDPSGQAFFAAHIRIERGRPPAPRLHFLDDTARTGLLYIGYLGPHLPSSRTN